MKQGTSIALGLAFGVVLGLLLDNLAIGLGIGIALGGASEAFAARRQDPPDEQGPSSKDGDDDRT